jgi:hypothetical protein
MSAVVIQGSGVAASCCGLLLARARLPVALNGTARPGLPAILLSRSAAAMMCDVFQSDGFLRGGHSIRRRVVCWRRQDSPRVFDHTALVISEAQIVSFLTAEIPEAPPEDATFRIYAAPPLPQACEVLRFGSRTVSVAKVVLPEGWDSGDCAIESHKEGWVFLLPTSLRTGVLLNIGAQDETLIAESRLLQGLRVEEQVASGLPAHPRVTSSMTGVDWLACGSAAMGFDPICGDGAAHAVREAILASAVMVAIRSGEDRIPVLRHYENRLLAGFHQHLKTAQQFYVNGFGGPWWQREANALKDGIEWSNQRLQQGGPSRYRLSGLELQPADP